MINGDIKLASIPVNGTNELIIKNINNATAINGGLMIGNGSSVYLSGKNSIFNGNISIDEDASMNLSVGNANVHANTITLKSDSWLNIDTSIRTGLRTITHYCRQTQVSRSLIIVTLYNTMYY